MFRIFASLGALLAVAGLPLAQEPKSDPTSFIVKPAAAPVPAFKYRLLPEIRDLQPGNAFVAYSRANNPLWLKAPSSKEMASWRKMPLDQLKREKVASKLPEMVLKQIDRGSRLDHCDWELLAQIRSNEVALGFPEGPFLLRCASWLAIRCRCEIAEGDLDRAIYTLQTMLALSRHLTAAPMLMHNIVGGALAAQARNGIEELIQQPAAPNLYWALTALPGPLLDFRISLEAERAIRDVSFPELKKLESGPLSAEDIARLTELIHTDPFDTLSQSDNSKKQTTSDKTIDLAGALTKFYPAARQALIEQGRKVADVDALPKLQVVLLHHYQQHRRLEEDGLKWTCVPFWEGQKGREQLALERKKIGPLLLFGDSSNVVDRLHVDWVVHERSFSALRCMEAVRLHVAATGKLPLSVDSITLVPIPVDPMSGKKFELTSAGDVVTLVSPAVRELPDGPRIHYRITIKR